VSIATLIRRMSDLGATPEMIALAVEEIEADRTCLEARRSADRERKREQREREKAANVTGRGAHVTAETPSPLVPPKVSPKPLSKNPPISPNPCVNGRERYHRLPEGWRPTKPIPAAVQAKVDLWPPGTFDDEVAAFKRWAANAENKNGKGKKLDWDKALWNWIGRRHDERYSRNNIVSIQRPRATNPLFEGYRAILDEEARQSAAEGGDGAWSPLSPTGSG
jgi:hypothetical protein